MTKRKIEFNARGLTDFELIDKYIGWETEVEVGVADPDMANEYHSICDEIDRRGIPYEQIEARKKELGLSKLVKCKDCKRLNVCQIRVSTEDPNVEIECSEYKEKEKMTDKEETWEEYRKRVYGLTTEEKEKEKEKGKKDNWRKPKPVATLTDMELIDEYVEIIGPDADALEYEHPKAREEVLREELKRRGITDKEISRHIWDIAGADMG